jgi:hypothetical protein
MQKQREVTMGGMHQSGSQASFLDSFGVEPRLHQIDYEDVALSREGARLVHAGAKAVMRQYMPGADFEKLTRAQAVAMFVDQLFWEENSGGLIMCADLPDTSLCLPIPRKHWSVRTGGAVQ